MTRTRDRDRIYQSSDLAGSQRKTFIADALESRARLRSPGGESLVMLREARLEHVASVSDYAVAYLVLDTTLRRPREQRHPGDYGPWAFLEAFEDDDIEDFQREINDAIVRAASGDDSGLVERVVHEWRMSAQTLADPVAREILEGRADDGDWVEVLNEPDPARAVRHEN